MAGTAQPIGAENGVRRYQLFINGKFTDSRSGKTFESISPHDRSVVAVVAEGDKADIDAAASAARGAYEVPGPRRRPEGAPSSCRRSPNKSEGRRVSKT